jgi:hypothetical protein
MPRRCVEFFAIDNEVRLYDVIITYFEAQRGCSRDHRSDFKQVCIAPVASFDGFHRTMKYLPKPRARKCPGAGRMQGAAASRA